MLYTPQLTLLEQAVSSALRPGASVVNLQTAITA